MRVFSGADAGMEATVCLCVLVSVLRWDSLISESFLPGVPVTTLRAFRQQVGHSAALCPSPAFPRLLADNDLSPFRGAKLPSFRSLCFLSSIIITLCHSVCFAFGGLGRVLSGTVCLSVCKPPEDFVHRMS